MSIDNDLKNRLFAEFRSESDRGCAVLTVCLLEKALANVFAQVLPGREPAARIFMPRGRLSVGISNAKALGLIADPNTTNLGLILKIRNAFAHKLMDGRTFESTEIRSLSMMLILPNLDGLSTDTRTRIENNSRERYMEVFGHEVANLERIAHVATPFPTYRSMQMYSVEV